MIVVCDTSPICYLLLIDHIGILPELYQVVIIPQAVADELKASESPPIIKNWITHPPNCYKSSPLKVPPEEIPAAALSKLKPLNLGRLLNLIHYE